MIQNLESSHIDPLRISLKEEYAHCFHVEAEPNGKPWYNDIKIYLEKWEYPEGVKSGQKKTIRRMTNDFSLNKEMLYKMNVGLGHLMKDIWEEFKITHQNSTAYRPQMNSAIEAANKNIKRILKKMTYNYKGWHEQFPYALLGYCTTARTSTGATTYLLVYGIEVVILAEVEIRSLRIILEAKLDNVEWVQARFEQLTLIDEKRMVAVCHGQLYRQRMARAFNKRVRT
ncbi:uncharacterized protein LOC132612891 [Lycium barbarum]|uniref:uncharacterized protein LOC132612891 n=1 Tax=Lycium barbarum TaxID=112863 RepID=UPI00293EAACD|nr:uncharacterized protein LOC132612891 [Lycium barbarum]